MLDNVELYKWILLERMIEALPSSKENSSVWRIMNIFKEHNVPVEDAIDILQKLAAIGEEDKLKSADIVSLTDIMKLRKGK